jgi:hypothetical protein
MATQLKLEDVEAKVVGAIKAALGDAATVLAMSTEHTDEDGNIIIDGVKPMVLVYFDGEDFIPMNDNLRTNYEDEQMWMAICFAKSLRSTADERASTYAITSRVRDAVAGQRLTLDENAAAHGADAHREHEALSVRQERDLVRGALRAAPRRAVLEQELKEISMAERGEDFVYVQLSKAGQEVAAGADGKGLVLGLGGADYHVEFKRGDRRSGS